MLRHSSYIVSTVLVTPSFGVWALLRILNIFFLVEVGHLHVRLGDVLLGDGLAI